MSPPASQCPPPGANRPTVPQRPPLQKRTYSAPVSQQLAHQQNQPRAAHPPNPPLTPRRSDASIIASASRDRERERSHNNNLARRPLYHHHQPSLTNMASPFQQTHQTPSSRHTDTMLHMNLALIGAPNVGKSTFMQHTLDLRCPPSSFSATKKMSLDDTIYLVRLVELDVDEVAVSANHDLIFPSTLPHGRYLPDRIHGALAIFDSSDLTTLTKYPQLFRAFSAQSSVPSIVVASKCDCECLSDDDVFNEAREIMGSTKIHQTAIDKDSHKRCISTILNLIISSPAWQDLRRLELSHSNRTSHQPRSVPHAYPPLSPSSLQPPTPSPKATTFNATPASITDDLSKGLNLTPEDRRATDALAPSPFPSLSSRDAGHLNPRLTLDFNGDHPQIEQQDILASTARHTALQTNSEEGLTFEELIARLVSYPTSKKDINFITIFLCLYRDFASPVQVLNALLGWYEKIDHSDEYYLLKYASKLHILQVLSQWLSEHPGDFSAGTITRKNLYALISNIENDAVFAFSAKELLSGLDIVVEDCDAGAFRFGNDLDPSSPQEVHKQLMSTPTYDPALYSPSDTSAAAAASPIVLQTKSRRSSRNPAEDLLDAPPHHTNIRRGSADTLGNESWTHSTATTAIPGDALSSVTNLLAAQETETQKPTTKTRLPVTKEVTKVFLAVPEEEFANEITRMDWVMYSSMRLREMCRYVRTPLAKRSTDPGVQNVHQMVASFNHVAAFVVTMILSRDSPKARAKIMTKFINIACKLRAQNNYNSLGAIIAGLDQAPIFRLRQTHQLMDPKIVNKFKSLQLLMGLRRSCYTYRLAWQNSFSDKIVYLALNLRDLNSAEVGNKTFLPGNAGSNSNSNSNPAGEKRINWRKFEVMGEVLMTVYYSQRTTHQDYARSETVRDLLFTHVLVEDEEEAINRSKLLEPPPNQGDCRMKRFYTFASRN